MNEVLEWLLRPNRTYSHGLSSPGAFLEGVKEMRGLSFWRRVALAAIGALLLAVVVPGATGSSRALGQTSCEGSCATISPAQGAPGTRVTATGSGWTAGDKIQAIWNGPTGTDVGSPVVVNSGGGFTLTFAVPSGTAPGSYQVAFYDAAQRFFEVANEDFTVTQLTVDQAVTAYTNAEKATSFNPGQGIWYGVIVTNPGNTPVSATFTVAVSGGIYPVRTTTAAVQPGIHTEIWPGTIPNSPVAGTYTNTETVVVGGTSYVRQSTFTVWAYNAGSYVGKSGMVSVDPSPEPNNAKYDDYCGPAASRVLISAWTKNGPSLSTLATEEKTDPNPPKSGTYISDMVTPINDAIGTKYYKDLGSAGSQAALSYRIGYDILHGHPLITGIKTGVGSTFLNGWDYSGFRVNHIVTIYGFDFSSPTQGKIYYMETSSPHAGTSKVGPQEINYQSFWILVHANDDQLAASAAG